MRSVLASVLLLIACGTPAATDAGSTGGGGEAGGGSGVGGGTGGGSSAGGGTGGSVGEGQGGGTDGGERLDAGTADAGLTSCTLDSDCPANAICRSSFNSMPHTCALRCTQQSDCPGATFCDPVGDGGTGGYCAPPSPAHCLECATSADCGGLSELCTSTSTDPLRTCHVDCSISGAAACPSDYTCTSVMGRMLCTPTGATCQDSLAGFCDILGGAQPCSTTTDAGSCTGQRFCISHSRYDLCSAPLPQCKLDCADLDHSGCVEKPCASAVNTPDKCGSCTNICPGFGKPNVNVACTSAACSFSCQGEHYDVDNVATNGCEVVDAPLANHVTAGAIAVGTVSCSDGNGHTVQGSGVFPSDQRGHGNPSVTGFDATSGSAPDWFTIDATGGTFCVNDIDLKLTVTGSSNPTCYQLVVVTNKGTHSCSAATNGTCSVTSGSGSYSGGNAITMTVSKTCSAATRGSPTYTIDGHL